MRKNFLGFLWAGILMSSQGVLAQSCGMPICNKDCLDYNSLVFAGIGCGYGAGICRAIGYSPNAKIALPVSQPANQVQEYHFMDQLSAGRAAAGNFLGSAQVGGDYRFRNGRFVLGLTAGGTISSTGWMRIPYPSTVIETGTKANVASTILPQVSYMKFRDGGWVDCGFRFGVAFGRAMVYAKVGWSAHNLFLQHTITGMHFQISRWVNCLVPGFGVDFRVAPNAIVGINTEVHLAQSRIFSFRGTDGWLSSVTLRPSIFSAMIFIKCSLQ